jgi:hypothetical protein
MKTDPHRGGRERFRVSKKNLEENLPNPSILNELQDWDTTIGDGLDEFWDDDYDSWYSDNKI